MNEEQLVYSYVYLRVSIYEDACERCQIANDKRNM